MFWRGFLDGALIASLFLSPILILVAAMMGQVYLLGVSSLYWLMCWWMALSLGWMD